MSATATTPQSSASEPPIRVLIVEDNPDHLDLLRRAVMKTPGLVLAGSYTTAEAALAELSQQAADLVLLDIHLPLMNGIECLRQLRRMHRKLRIVMITSDRDDELLLLSLRAGADGYVTKPCDRHTLARIIRETMAGQHPIAPDMAGHLIAAVVNPPKRRLVPHPKLSERENEAMRWLAEGLGNGEIAERMGVSVFTVNAHLQSIYGKLKAGNRVEALRAVERG